MLWGEYLAYNVNGTMSSILPQRYSQSLASSTLITPNSFGPVTFTITIGNSNLVANFKDIRIWSVVRDPSQLYSFRFKQVLTSSGGLVLNYKMMDGQNIVYN